MKSFAFILLLALSLFSNSIAAQQTHERFATKIARTSLLWPGLNTRNEACGIQFINSSSQINLVIYPSNFQWNDPAQGRAFLEQYLDEANHKSAHFDGTVTIVGERNLTIPGTRSISCQGNWTLKGSSRPGTLAGTLEVIRPGEIRVTLSGAFSLDQWGIIPQDRSVLDIPSITQVEVFAVLPGM